MNYKNNNNKIFALVFVIFAFFMSGSVFAATGHEDTIDSILTMGVHFDPTKENVDYFHLWMRYLFGSFIFKPWTGADGDITLLSSALGFTNVLSLSFGVIVVYYTFVGGALNTAHSGEVLGKNWSTIWMPIRTASGLGLIMPASSIGGGVLSTAQVLMLWLIITGSNAASFLWSNSIQYLAVHGNGYNAVVDPGYKPFKELSELMMCVDHRAKAKLSISGTSTSYNLASPNSFNIGTAQVYTGSSFVKDSAGTISESAHEVKSVPINVSVSRTQNAGTYSGYITSMSGVKNILSSGSLIKGMTFTNCGSITVYNREDGTLNVGTVDNKTQAQISAYEATALEYQKSMGSAVEAAYALVSDIGNIAGGNPALAQNYLKSSLDTSKENKEAKEALSAFQKQEALFRTNANAMAVLLSKQIPGKLATEWEKVSSASDDKMQKGGWASAGLWFIEIGNLSEAVNSYASNLKDSVSGNENAIICYQSSSYGSAYSPCGKSQKYFDSSMNILNKIYTSSVKGSELANGTSTNSASKISPDDELVALCPSSDDCSLTGSDVSRWGQSLAKGLLDLLADFGSNDTRGAKSSVDGSFFSMDGMANPFKTLSSIGHVMNNIGASVYGAYLFLTVAGAVVKGASEGWASKLTFGITEAAGSGTSAGLKALATILLPLAMSIFMFGFTLAYMIPLLPVITWINMMVGYLVTVIEATTATPIAIVQMLTPEGQGIVGQRLERAMQLIIVAVMKPSLMIIGLIASISISTIAFTIFSMYFWEAAKIVLHGSIVDFLALITIYTTTAVALTRTVVSIMYNLPTHILEWFAAGVGSRSFGEGDIGQSVERSLGEIKSQGEQLRHQLLGNGGRRRKGGRPPTPHD